MAYALRGAFFIRAFVALIPRRHRLCTCQETYHRQQAGLARLETNHRHNRSSQLRQVRRQESEDYVGGAFPHGRAREIGEPLAKLHNSFWLPQYAVAAQLLQIDRCTTTLRKASITRKRSAAAQYVYTTKAK